jgi:D-alanyl-D-alanine carboxypeptidase
MKKLALFTLIFALIAGIAAAGQAAEAPFDVKAVDALVAAEVQARGLVGITLAVARDGKLVLSRGYGLASLADRRPVSEETMFAIGSVTKQFTCACILLLAEDGKLSPQDKVAKYYPSLTKADGITLLDLMNHVSGYPDYYPLDFVDRRLATPRPVDEVIHLYGTGKLDFEPGTRYSYSNTGYDILGRIVEKVSGEPYGEFLARRILKPLGLENTTYEPDPASLRFAQGYSSFALSGPEPAIPEGKGWVSAAGAIYSTASDLVRWDLALMSGKVLKPESFKLMTSPRKLADGRMSNYGCGLSVGDRGGTAVLGHNGAVAGFLAYNTMVPSTGTAVAMISNFDASGDASAVFRKVLLPLLPPVPPAPAAAEAKKDTTPQVVPGIPKIAGLPAPEEARTLFLMYQSGKVDRSVFSEDFNEFLTEAKVKGAAARLAPFGEPTAAAVESMNERGGMEVTTVRLTFASGSLRALMYRTPDGKIQQYFIYKD